MHRPTLIRNVVSAETSDIIADMLAHSVSDSDASGVLHMYQAIGWEVKPGTSEKLDAKEDGKVTKNISSFLGIAPAEDPKVAVLVMLDEPYIKNSTGAVAAAPVVGAILGDILPLMDIEPGIRPR
jgi:stage V sporulation protein D (sporulation-specific penicillin-binding protein)